MTELLLCYKWRRNINQIFKAMKCTILLLLIGCMNLYAEGFSQSKISLKVQSSDLKEALALIEKQSDVRFLYTQDVVKQAGKVSVEANNEALVLVLDKLLAGTGITYKILEDDLVVLNIGDALNSAEKNVTGKIVDSSGAAIGGASVTVKGTKNGVAADAKGVFVINASDNAVLLISALGFVTKEVTVSGDEFMNITLLASQSSSLEQVVVVGYGTQRKRDITGSTASVSGAELAKQPVLTATQAVQGKVAGVQVISSGAPGTSPQIRIRGTGTALSTTKALFVVDGVLTDDISNINTADIVDMNILKDASASAIYGSRGANGVIIITTKKGTLGKMKINYNNNIGVRTASNLVKMADAKEYANYYQAATGQIAPASSTSTDWYNTILRNGFQQSHNVSLSGGNDKALYFFSAGYLTDEGIVIDNDFTRFTVRANNEFRISRMIKVGVQTSYTNSVNKNGFNNIDIDAEGDIGSVYNDAYRAAPVIPDIVNGKYGNTSAYQNVGNPLLDIKSNSIRVRDDRLQGTGYLEIKPLTWLTFKSSIGGDLDNKESRAYNYKFLADENTFIVAGGNQANTRSNLNIKNARSLRWVWDNIITVNKRFDQHNINLVLGTTAEKLNSSWVRASRKDVPADPNLWYINNGDADASQNEGTGDAWARNSYLGRLNYGFADKYLLTATFRRDGSSLFPLENRWRNYPSAGAAWVVSKEGFMENQKIVDFLKLRASWGRVGNDGISTGEFSQSVSGNQAYPYGGSGSAATNGSLIDQIKDPNLDWETTEEYDAAIEFTALKGRLTGEVDYYNKKVKNALIYVAIPSTVGDADGKVLTNAASIENKGWEFSLNWNDKINKNLSYKIGGNITLNDNNVIGLNGGQPLPDGSIGASQGFITLTTNGRPVGAFNVLQVVGVFNSDAEVAAYVDKNGKKIQPDAHAGDFKYLDNDGNGKIDDDDRIFAGSYQPKTYFGINLGVTWKDLDLSIDCYGNTGNQVYNGKKGVRVQGTDNVESDIVYSRWSSANHTQTEPGANVGNQLASTYYIEPGDFFRINNVTLSYAVRAAFLNKIKVESLRVFAQAQNLFTFKKYSGFTAELPGSPVNSGIELTSYPTTRTISAGINIGF